MDTYFSNKHHVQVPDWLAVKLALDIDKADYSVFWYRDCCFVLFPVSFLLQMLVWKNIS
ncbi:hypothetical protein JOC34_001078 [Virgibacillus halotolerans]|nr:hypothetical protein [Virgibacillus halotolerans]